MTEKKQRRDISGLNSDVAKSLTCISEENRLAVNQGTFGNKLIEPVPILIRTESEEEIRNENNASIVLGRDRPANVMSGYGGRGDTQAASIHLVTGRMAHKPRSDVYVDPDFQADAACIYISQKTDIDANFRLTAGNVGSPEFFEMPRSGVALKADGIRVCARDGGIKLVTGVDAMNSQGGKIKSRTGIDLIAGNDDGDMQPIPKGINLIRALESLAEEVVTVAGIVSLLANDVQALGGALMAHTHPVSTAVITAGSAAAQTGTGAGTALPSIDLPLSLAPIAMNLALQVLTSLAIVSLNEPVYKLDYLNPLGKYYINSEHNYTN